MSGRLLDKPVNGRYPFEYRNSSQTNVAETFAKARAKLEAEKQTKAIVREIKRK